MTAARSLVIGVWFLWYLIGAFSKFYHLSSISFGSRQSARWKIPSSNFCTFHLKMHFDGWVSDIIIGMDFGMTCIGMTIQLRRFDWLPTLMSSRGVLTRSNMVTAKVRPPVAAQDDQRACEQGAHNLTIWPEL